MADFTWDAAAGRYRAAGGHFVAEAAVRGELDAFLDIGTARLTALAERLRTGALPLAEWEPRMMTELRALHTTAAALAHGGWAQMSAADYGWTGAQLRGQYGYLRDFAVAVSSGQQRLDGTLAVRAELYGQAARGTYESMRTRDQVHRGAQEARRVLHALEHCPGCVEQAGRSWVPIAQVAPIGSQQCRSRCRCTIAYRRGAEAAA